MKLQKSILISLILLFCSSVSGQESNHFLFGIPKGANSTNTLIIRDIYTLSNNKTTKFADYVAYTLNVGTITGESIKERRWKPDPDLKESDTLEPDDYKSANAVLKTDRGHQAPLASFKGTKAWRDTNYLSNITPQKADLNRGPWLGLENAVRELVKISGSDIYVITGPVYSNSTLKLPEADEPHILPSGYFKIVAIRKDDSIKSVGFYFNQDTPRKADFKNHTTSIDNIETQTGLDFFWELEDNIENDIEKKVLAWSYMLSGNQKPNVPRNQNARSSKPISVKTDTKTEIKALTVYTTNSGKKYHTGSCRYLKKSKIPILLTEAKREGLTACKVCKPGK